MIHEKATGTDAGRPEISRYLPASEKYRDVVWGLELSVQQVKRRFQMEVGSSIKDFLDSIYLAGVDFRITALKNRPEALKKAIKC